jgi:hypothetical protein
MFSKHVSHRRSLRTSAIAVILVVASIPTVAQDIFSMTKDERAAYFARISRESWKDHQRMLKLMKIDSLRSGVNGMDPAAWNAVNYDESKANPFPQLPDPLVLNNGKKVVDAKTWWNIRKAEITRMLDQEVYGIPPRETPRVEWKVVSSSTQTEYNIPVIVKKLSGVMLNQENKPDSSAIDLLLVIPAEAKARVPVIIELSFNFPPGFFPPENGPGWKEQVLKRSWAYAVVIPTSFQPDNGASLHKGVIGMTNHGKPRQPSDWGTLKAWAWGASRVLDYLETDKAVDSKKVAITGHSRYGKAAAVAMAYDPRFAIAYVSSSGEGGLKPHRRNFGETVENLAASGEYHWVAGNFLKYAGPLGWNDLPVDAHHLLALCAPRPVFIGCGVNGDNWVDPRGSFMTAVAAEPVYQLLGDKGLGTSTFPPVDSLVSAGALAFRQHNGGHTPGPNWEYFLRYAANYFK